MGEAGWYNDETDPALARWHDGERWTEHTLVKAEWTGPGAPPPPADLEPVGWVPPDRPDPLPMPAPLASRRSVKDRYRAWPRWARIAAPVAVAFLVISAVTSSAGDDGGDRVEASAGADADAGDELPTIEEASSAVLGALDVAVTPRQMAALVGELCDTSRTGAATELAAITSDPDEQRQVLNAADDAAREACPESVEDAPTLLAGVYAALTTTTTTGPAVSADDTTLEASTTTAARATTRGTAPGATTTKAPPRTQAPTTQPPATQPPATQPPATQPPAQGCHPSYTGACLDPDSPDYDCAGGGGNGPDYTGPVTVVGPDEYDLDADNDGYGCENG